MKQLIKQWWNGKTVVIDEGGYVPRVVEERPWLRKFYENDKTGFWAIVVCVGTPFWMDLYDAVKTILKH